MRQLLLAAVAAISLSGCATQGNGPPPAPADLVKAVQDFTVKACGFLPLVDNAFVASLIAAYFPQGVGLAEGAAVIGRAICAGVTVPTVRRRGTSGQLCKRVETPRGLATVCGVPAARR